MKTFIYSLIFSLVVLTGSAQALDLRSAKTQGLVGETATGYLAPVKTADQAIQNLVADINAKRKAHYQGIAAKNKTPLQAVEQLAGKKAMEKTPDGQYINDGSGWKKK